MARQLDFLMHIKKSKTRQLLREIVQIILPIKYVLVANTIVSSAYLHRGCEWNHL